MAENCPWFPVPNISDLPLILKVQFELFKLRMFCYFHMKLKHSLLFLQDLRGMVFFFFELQLKFLI